jgi:hypothetical protein
MVLMIDKYTPWTYSLPTIPLVPEIALLTSSTMVPILVFAYPLSEPHAPCLVDVVAIGPVIPYYTLGDTYDTVWDNLLQRVFLQDFCLNTLVNII